MNIAVSVAFGLRAERPRNCDSVPWKE